MRDKLTIAGAVFVFIGLIYLRLQAKPTPYCVHWEGKKYFVAMEPSHGGTFSDGALQWNFKGKEYSAANASYHEGHCPEALMDEQWAYDLSGGPR